MSEHLTVCHSLPSSHREQSAASILQSSLHILLAAALLPIAWRVLAHIELHLVGAGGVATAQVLGGLPDNLQCSHTNTTGRY